MLYDLKEFYDTDKDIMMYDVYLNGQWVGEVSKGELDSAEDDFEKESIIDEKLGL
jgi:hypothetical protein